MARPETELQFTRDALEHALGRRPKQTRSRARPDCVDAAFELHSLTHVSGSLGGRGP